MPDETSERPTPHVPWWKGPRGEWYVVVQAVLFVLIAFGWRLWPNAPAWPEPFATAASILGFVLMLAGIPLAVTGLIALQRARSLTALPYPTDEAHLVETGPYAIVRHPIYSGLILGFIGLGLWRHALLTIVFTLALFVLFDLKSRREEAWLIERFPEYREYCRRVKKLLPWLY
jgi:protein-S-isoprenylcysteine O-methyltransferase Ste14